MSAFNNIERKLHQFTKKFYYNELIKGILLFFSLGVLYFFFTLFIEHFLWLSPNARTLLFWLFVVVEALLLFRFICRPILKLIGLQKRISFEESSKIIGNHFPKVQDKLLNVIQLKNRAENSDLLLASIDQKAKELQPIPFKKAINFKKNKKYAKYALIPVFIGLLIFLSGQTAIFNNSLERVVNYRTAYTPPAPFAFSLASKSLTTIQGKPLKVEVKTIGNVVPDEVKIAYNNQQYYLQNLGNGRFIYTFKSVVEPITFYFIANDVISSEYNITIIPTPTIQQVELSLNYPKYLRKPKEEFQSTGNLRIPEGTEITWNVKTNQTENVKYISNGNETSFIQEASNNFTLSKKFRKSTNYSISSSNKNLKNYELLPYSVEVIKDEFPTIFIESNIDSISRGIAQFAGQISDDYGLQKLELVYYDINKPEAVSKLNIPISKTNIQTFFYSFPDNLELNEGTSYELYFQVFDNDGVNGSKKAKSKKFNFLQKTEEEIEQELIEEQKNYIKDLEKTLTNQKKQKNQLQKLENDLQSKKNLNWNDKKNLQQLFKRQEQYKDMMQRQTDLLKENFDEKKEKSETLQEKKEALKKRIEELKKLERQDKLLKELQKMAEKLNKEELLNKVKELSEQNKQQERSLERILELTKRFYVEQKTMQIANKLENLSKKQEELSKKNSSTTEQEKVKKEFNKIEKELKELQKENNKLKEPMDIPSEEELQKEINKELQKAQENLTNQNQKEAQKSQKKSSKKMQQMSQNMQQLMSAMNSMMKEENIQSLKQILENLLTFSFKQEDIMNTFENTTVTHPNFGKNLKTQNQLKTYFEHIDDSLYVLSMRLPNISTKIQDNLSSAHYNLDQSLENFSENRFNNGVSNQRYVMTASNELADFLSDILDNLQKPKSSAQGKGKKGGKSFSLPDIIKKQNDVMKKMQEGNQKGKGKKKEGGEKQGNKGNQKQNSQGKGEDLDGQIYQIYKEQSELRQELENALKQGGSQSGKARQVLKKMEQLENEILEKGFNQGTIQRMQQLQYELLKLEKATFEQNKDKQRKSTTNLEQFKQLKIKELQLKKLFYNQTEILNRQSLPLQQNYKKKVQEYFSKPKKN